MRQRGKSFAHILERTSFNNVMEIAHAIKAYEISMVGGQEVVRQEAINADLARIDLLMSEAWDIVEMEHWKTNKNGDATERDYSVNLKAIDTVAKLLKQRAEILQFNAIDLSSSQSVTVLVSGATNDYVQTLKEIVQAD